MNKCLVIKAFGYQLVYFYTNSMTAKREKERGKVAACSTQGVCDKQHKRFIATSALAHERERER